MPGSNEDTFTEKIDGVSFQINIYSKNRSALEAMELSDHCLSLFDGAVIPVAGGRNVTLKRNLVTPPWKNGDEWVASIELSTFLQEG
jgi:inosine-uridine nucleoside N-ribohydrolase